MYSFWSSLRPVRRTSFAFTPTTKSPPSPCGVKVGLCLPRRIGGTCEAKRPSTLSRASATNQRRTTSAFEMLRVGFFGLGKAVLSEGGSARGMGYLNPGCGSTMIAHQDGSRDGPRRDFHGARGVRRFRVLARRRRPPAPRTASLSRRGGGLRPVLRAHRACRRVEVERQPEHVPIRYRPR